MFGRRGRESKENREEAAREVSRRALFEELAKRPPNICPFLGLASSQTEYHDGFTREHRCYAFGDPVELSAEQQERVCLGRGYGNCPRYLRGVLVIPTDELEALRRPLPPVRPAVPPVVPPPPSSPPKSARADDGGRRRAPLLIGLVLLVAALGAAGAVVYFNGPGVAVNPTPSPSVTNGPSASPSASLSVRPSQSTTPIEQTPFPETPKPDPTPLPGDTFQGYEVTVLEGQNTIFEVNDAGDIVRSETANFSRFSKAPVDKVVASNGLLHWRTSEGFFIGLSYIHGQSGAFLIREVYAGSDGQTRYIVLKDSET